MTGRYVLGALRRRPLDTVAAAVAIGLTVAFLASLGSFISATGSRLTERAASRVGVDWQVQLGPGADTRTVSAALRSVPGVRGWRPVSYATVPGLRSSSPSGVRTTGTAFVVALPDDYSAFAPAEVRPLVGSSSGIRLLQQTAANLSAAPGSTVEVLGTGQRVTVAGVADLPDAQSFFQTVGAPPGTQPSAPPDDVLLVPASAFSKIVGNSPVTRQLHLRLDHARLPTDPAAAADEVTHQANHVTEVTAGAVLVGDNLEAALSGAREDALYSRLLVLLLGAPGLVLSAVVTALVIALRNERQRRDLGLLRMRGASPRRSAVLFSAIAVGDAVLGVALGLLGAVAATRLAQGPASGVSFGWALAGAVTGLLLALAVELAPVARLLGSSAATVAEQVSGRPPARSPLALRLGLDVVLLAASAVAFWLTSRSGYQVVVVPEGVPVASVNYAGLLAPALAWPGLALLTWRVTAMAVRRLRPRAEHDPNGRMPDLRHAVLRRRRQLVARGATGLAVALAVVVSAAVFTTTYDRQARVDVALTVGSDVAVTLPPDSTTTLDPVIAERPGVLAVEQVAHRLAYVGPDLQDLYGVDAATVGRAAPLQDAFTPGGSVKATFATLARTPDGVLLSQETLHDYQLQTGDTVRLRLRDADGRYRAHPFHVVGVITEFATAPRDSFVLANRAYVAQVTGAASVQTLLVRTDQPHQVAAGIRAPAGATVDDISAPKSAVTSASGLAAGSLAGLARLVLSFGVLLAAGCVVLVLVAGAVQRRRSTVALAILGASARQRGGFLRTEARWVVLSGLLGGLVSGTVVAYELVKVLNGIFDPPPEHLTVPWLFLGATTAGLLATSVVAVACAARWLGGGVSGLRDT